MTHFGFTSLRISAILTLFALPLLISHSLNAKRITTTHKVVKKTYAKSDKSKSRYVAKDQESLRKVLAGENSIVDVVDSIPVIFSADSVSFSGYDKTVSSSIETFLVTNRNPIPIQRIEVRITYLDMNGRMLHSRVAEAYCFVPPGETRKADIPTWDKQKTYYYYLGPEPKRVATPYKVTIQPRAFYFSPAYVH